MYQNLSESGTLKSTLKDLYVQLCCYLNDSFKGKNVLGKINWLVILVIASAIYYPIATGRTYFDDIGYVVIAETFYALFLFTFLSCVVLFYKYNFKYWLCTFSLIIRYLTFIGFGSELNRHLSNAYLLIIVICYVYLLSFNIANRVIKEKDKKPTVIFSVGITSFIVGILISTSEQTYHKWFILLGAVIILFCIISIAILRFTKGKSLFKIMCDIILFFIVPVILIFTILCYAGVPIEITTEIIIPVATAIVDLGCALTNVWLEKSKVKKTEDKNSTEKISKNSNEQKYLSDKMNSNTNEQIKENFSDQESLKDD